MLPAPPPPPAKRPHAVSALGRTWTDDYAWLRADNWREVLRDPTALPPEIRTFLEAENEYCEAVLAPLSPLREQLAAEMRARLKEDDSDPPAPDGPWNYYARYRPGGQHRLYCRTPRAGGEEAILLDGDARANGGFLQIAHARHSPDHARFAWSQDSSGAEIHEIRALAVGEAELADVVPQATGDFVWTQDSLSFLYVRQDEHHRPYQIRLHRLGEPASSDKLIFEEADPAWFVGLRGTRLGRRAFVHVHGHDAQEFHVLDLGAPETPPRLMAPRRPKFRYTPADHGDRFFIKTDRGFQDFEIVEAPADAPDEANWRPYIAGVEGRLIEDFTVFQDYLVVLARQDNRPRLIVRELASGDTHEIAFDAPTYFLRLETTYEFASRTLRFSYSTMATPQETFDYDMGTRARTLVKKQPTPPDFDEAAYLVEALEAEAPDGARVPVSLLRRRDTQGPAPTLIYGYGAYGYGIDAAFGANRFSLVDRGFVFAIAHVRGGTEKGMAWYEAGKLANKPNTFSDFIAATRALVAQRYADPRRIVCLLYTSDAADD